MKGSPAEMLLWSGDLAPPEQAVASIATTAPAATSLRNIGLRAETPCRGPLYGRPGSGQRRVVRRGPSGSTTMQDEGYDAIVPRSESQNGTFGRQTWDSPLNLPGPAGAVLWGDGNYW